MAENGRWATTILILCFALEEPWVVDAVVGPVSLGQREAKYTDVPEFVQRGYVYRVKKPQFSYPVYDRMADVVEQLPRPPLTYPYVIRRAYAIAAQNPDRPLQRHVTLASTSENPPSAVIIVENITYMPTSKFCYEKVPKAYGSTLDNCSQVRKKREVAEPTRVSLMDAVNNKADPTANSLQLKTRENLNKLKRDLETFRNTIENRKQAVLNRAAEVKAKYKQLEEKLNKLYGGDDTKNEYEERGLKSKGVNLYDLEEEILNADNRRETRHSNANTDEAKPGNADSVSTLGENFVTKLLMKKIIEEPALLKFIKDYLLRFVSTTTVRGLEDEDTGDAKEGKVNVKRSDGSDSGAHAAAARVRNEKTSLRRRLQKLKMEGLEKVVRGESVRGGQCECLGSPSAGNKYGIKANTARTSSSGLKLKTLQFGRSKTNQELSQLKPFKERNAERTYDAMSDLAALLQDQQCNCAEYA